MTERARTDGNATDRGRLLAARLVRLITMVVVGLIVVGILLVVLEASPDNGLVSALLDAARWLVTPFKGIFDLDGRKPTVAVNWGLAAVVYGAIGLLIARVLAR